MAISSVLEKASHYIGVFSSLPISIYNCCLLAFQMPTVSIVD